MTDHITARKRLAEATRVALRIVAKHRPHFDGTAQEDSDARYEMTRAIAAALAAAPDDGADRVISDLLIASAPYADMDETGRLPKAREQAERLLNEPDLSAKQRYANHYEEQIGFLVERFAEALSSKLRKAEEKYQYQGAWRRDSWHDALVQQIRRHMDKGDPLDVAAYCAFAWHHGWTLAAPHTSAESALAAAEARVREGDAKKCDALQEAALRRASEPGATQNYATHQQAVADSARECAAAIRCGGVRHLSAE